MVDFCEHGTKNIDSSEMHMATSPWTRPWFSKKLLFFATNVLGQKQFSLSPQDYQNV